MGKREPRATAAKDESVYELEVAVHSDDGNPMASSDDRSLRSPAANVYEHVEPLLDLVRQKPADAVCFVAPAAEITYIVLSAINGVRFAG